MSRRALIFSVFLLLGGFGRAAEAPADVFDKANQAYQAGRYADARDLYNTLVDQGRVSDRLFFNLGNAYFRLGDRGRARLAYERASLLNPLDEDIRYNLQQVLSLLSEKDGSLKTKLSPWTGFSLWALFAVNIAFWFSVLLGFKRKSEAVWWARWALGLLWLTGLGAAAAFLPAQREDSAIILADQTEARSGPGSDQAVGFVLPEGSKVALLRQDRDWWEVGVAEKGLKGWVPSSSLEAVGKIKGGSL